MEAEAMDELMDTDTTSDHPYDALVPLPRVSSPLATPFLSVDVIREVASYLVDDPRTVSNLTCVSQTCHMAILRNPAIWKSICHHRWKRKWGYAMRWREALIDAAKQGGKNADENLMDHLSAISPSGSKRRKRSSPSFLSSSPSDSASRPMSMSMSMSISTDGAWWRNRFHWQEQDALRTNITAQELHSLTFDFRFWLSQFFGEGNLLASGLKWTASQDFQFTQRLPQQRQDNSSLQHINPELIQPGTERGMIRGHPSGRTDLEWFLHKDGKEMQWGKLPLLFPRGTVHRLKTWGWEIRNPNVCLRALDYEEIVEEVSGRSTVTRIVIKRSNDQNNNNNSNSNINISDEIWGDYISHLRRFPTDFGMPQEGIAFIEAPESFWSFAANRQRFPRLGIDEIQVMEE